MRAPLTGHGRISNGLWLEAGTKKATLEGRGKCSGGMWVDDVTKS
jgi:hypothetical protein